MSFGLYARKVRDPSLSYRHRVSALRSCVQLYRPIGFEASLAYLRARAGPFRDDEAALLRALDLLEASRAAWHAAVRDYDARRREAKRRGRRVPHPSEHNPNSPGHWYGARREAALEGVRYWRRHRLGALLVPGDATAAETARLARACDAADGRLSPDDLASLASCAERLGGRIDRRLYLDDAAAYYRARDLRQVARLVAQAATEVSPSRT